MRALRFVLPLLGLVAALHFPLGLAQGEITIEGETGIPVLEECAHDGETMYVRHDALFFPAAGCTASYLMEPPDQAFIHSARVRVFGDDIVCGHIVLAGAVAGASSLFCPPYGVWMDVGVVAVGSTGAFPVTWSPDVLASPYWTNLELDLLRGTAL